MSLIASLHNLNKLIATVFHKITKLANNVLKVNQVSNSITYLLNSPTCKEVENQVSSYLSDISTALSIPSKTANNRSNEDQFDS